MKKRVIGILSALAVVAAGVVVWIAGQNGELPLWDTITEISTEIVGDGEAELGDGTVREGGVLESANMGPQR